MKNLTIGSFPNSRLRRFRKTKWMRDLTAQHSLQASDLILPLFVIEGQNKKEEIKNLPDVYRFSIDLIVAKAKEAQELGIPAIMLFPATLPELKTANGKEAYNENNLICRTIAAIKKEVPEMGVICDVALDPYTSHGHDGIIDDNGYVLNDETVEILCKQAVTQAKAGCDIIAPSDMMDGRVGQIRKSLDEAGFQDLAIMSYSAKYASSFYGPFRDAVGSSSSLKSDKKTYQMDYRNRDDALKEIAQDVDEGADFIIVKPGISYLDVVKEASQNFATPIISYQVSGEYAMLKFGAQNGILNFEEALLENLISFKRAGAASIISYGAVEIAKLLEANFVS